MTSRVDPFFLEVRRQFVQNLVFLSGVVFSRNFFDILGLMTVLAGYVMLTYLTVFVRGVTFSLAGGHTLPYSDFVHWHHAGRRATPFIVVFCVLLVSSLLFGKAFFLVTAAILFVGMMHDLFFRTEVLLDVFSIAVEFVLKAVAGALVLGLPSSPWLIICTFLLAMLISIGQRRNEIHLVEDGKRRPVLAHYSAKLLDQMLSVAASSCLVAYSLYTIDPRTVNSLGTEWLVSTVPLVLYGVLRYLYLVYTRDISGGIERHLPLDRPIAVCMALWLVAVFLMIYL